MFCLSCSLLRPGCTGTHGADGWLGKSFSMPFPGKTRCFDAICTRASPYCQLKCITISRNRGVEWISSLSGYGTYLCHSSTHLCYSCSHFCHFRVVCFSMVLVAPGSWGDLSSGEMTGQWIPVEHPWCRKRPWGSRYADVMEWEGLCTWKTSTADLLTHSRI